jgi:Flp pilus assembly protein TadG
MTGKRLTSRAHGSRRGVAAVELAMLLPLILILLFGLWEVGRAIDVQQIMSNAAREGGRQASTGQLSNSQVEQVVINYLQDAGFPATNAVVTVENLTTPGTDARDALQLDRYQITVTLPFNDVRWLALNYILPADSTITASAVWTTLKDRDYPGGVGAPTGE